MKTRKRKSLFPVILIAAGILLLIVMAVLLVGQMNSPGRISTTNPVTDNIPYPNIQRVSLADSYLAYQQGTAIFVDVRSSESFQQEHIPGSINIPSDQIETQFQTLDPQKWIITYCT